MFAFLFQTNTNYGQTRCMSMYSPNPTPSSSSESSKSVLTCAPQLQTKCGFFFLHYLHVALQQCYTPAAIMFNYQNAKMYPFEILASKPDVFIFKGPSLLFSNRGPTLDQNTFEPISCSCRFLFLLKYCYLLNVIFTLTPSDSRSVGTKCLPVVISFHRIAVHCNPPMELTLQMGAAAIHSNTQ